MNTVSEPSSTILRVAVFPPAPINHYLDYTLRAGAKAVEPGTRVHVRIGRQRRLGLVMEQSDHSDLAFDRLREVDAVLDQTPIVSSDMLKLICWTAEYYHYPIGRVLVQTLPKFFRQGKALEHYTPKVWGAYEQMDACQLSRAPKQKQLYELLLTEGTVSELILDETFRQWRPLAKALLDKGLVYTRKLNLAAVPTKAAVKMNSAQISVVERLRGNIGKFSCHLLEGVTGSGKTEIYMGVAEQVMQAGQQVLVMVPEISLIPQTLKRFEQRFGAIVAAFHSDMNEVQRSHSWYRACSNDIKIIVSARSGIFMPFTRLGLIVVDEEHDSSYKQNDRLRYHARDLAVKRAQLLDIPVILGSATPSLESLHHSIEKRYQYHRLNKRIGKAGLPQYEVIDLRQQTIRSGLSGRLIEMMHERIERGEQTLLFLNRRGYAPKVLCHDCGQVIECPRCDVALTYHAYNGALLCHHCGKRMLKPDYCPGCGKANLLAIGVGTERIEAELQTLFKDTSVMRIDADSTQRKGELEKRLLAVKRGEVGILIGTQMITKGHHFPDVTLTGIINVDQRLFSSDFRSVEQLGQMVVQVAGRAGRGDKPGVVALQTHHPEHEVLQCLLRRGYHHFARLLLPTRELALMPPYRFLALLNAESQMQAAPMRFLEFAARQFNRYASGQLEVLGPVPLMMEKRKGCYRVQLLLNAPDRLILNRTLTAALPAIQHNKDAGKVRWYLDVDPMELE